MARVDPQIEAHLEWMGYVQPVGLVVSAPALVRNGAILPRNDSEGQRLLREVFSPADGDSDADETAKPRFAEFAECVLNWGFSPKFFAGVEETPIPPELELNLPEFGTTLSPDYAVRHRSPEEGTSEWQLIVSDLVSGTDFDRVLTNADQLELSPSGRLERLLRETGVAAGVLYNGEALRLISAPRGESSGWIDFRFDQLRETAGRPLCAALRLLLSQSRLLLVPEHERLASLLVESRRFQNEVSEKLSGQVLEALYVLLRGFQAADDSTNGDLLREVLDEHPDSVYHGLLTSILRLVFLLYAEERGMLPEDEIFSKGYSLTSLHRRLRDDAAQYPDTMSQRYGAWAQLLVLFRMVHDGVDIDDVEMPSRRGSLFDPNRFPFLEGRSLIGARQVDERIEVPLVSDGIVHAVLDKLLVLAGERISYRALDVEQIGSVYETMMGFHLERATGRSVAIRPSKRYGASVVIDLDKAMVVEPGKRVKWLQGQVDRKLPAKTAKDVKSAEDLPGLHDALDKLIDSTATPDLLVHGSMILQPGDERRRSGSHYTPRSLTEPIVRDALRPVLERLTSEDSVPLPEQILDLKICDPAIGSGAFLVEACRQLGDVLVDSWAVHGGQPEKVADEDEVMQARRIVAQRCIYGVDKNAMAVDLAKMSIWLVTLARDHPFTFVDHALRHGDSLVGLTRRQIERFDWKTSGTDPIETIRIGTILRRFSELRSDIREAGDDVSDWELRDLWDEADSSLSQIRLIGNLTLLAYFSGKKQGPRKTKLAEFVHASTTDDGLEPFSGLVDEAKDAPNSLIPFHWEIEFPEVFDRPNPGFDLIVGNPPFLGGRKISETFGPVYSEWLNSCREGITGGADLVAHFFRLAFDIVRRDGTLGLIATNTIGQGDTRAGGLRHIRQSGGTIFKVIRRYKWPGQAAVVVSVIHIYRGVWSSKAQLDGVPVNEVTAFLFHAGGDDDPLKLEKNSGQSFQGSIILGMGFTFDDTDKQGVASTLGEMDEVLRLRPESSDVISPYIGSKEVNTDPQQEHHRYVINLGDRSEEECRQKWPEVMSILDEKIKPERINSDPAKYPGLAEEWWKYWRPRTALYESMEGLERVLVTGCGATTHLAVAFQPTDRVFAHSLAVFPFGTEAAFAAMQSRVHEVWARFFSSTLGDGLRYTPSDCFETFPFPEEWAELPELELVGDAYYSHRAELMIANDEGLTKTYNRFHDQEETNGEILRLRELHAGLDRAMLDAYGWSDIPTVYEFFPEHDNEGDSGKMRYRWTNEIHDDVLARLIELNGQRAMEESS